MKLLIGWTTVESEADAQKLAQELIGEKLAACVHVDSPVKAWYRWQGKLESGNEIRLMVKFPEEKAPAIKAWIEQNHPYDTPQWIVVEAVDVADGYLKWVEDVC